MAVISLLLSFTFSWPNAMLFSLLHALTMWMMAFFPPSPLLHIRLPSMLITCPSLILAID
jgi:hypothetical protein